MGPQPPSPPRPPPPTGGGGSLERTRPHRASRDALLCGRLPRRGRSPRLGRQDQPWSPFSGRPPCGRLGHRSGRCIRLGRPAHHCQAPRRPPPPSPARLSPAFRPPVGPQLSHGPLSAPPQPAKVVSVGSTLGAHYCTRTPPRRDPPNRGKQRGVGPHANLSLTEGWVGFVFLFLFCFICEPGSDGASVPSHHQAGEGAAGASVPAGLSPQVRPGSPAGGGWGHAGGPGMPRT